MVALPEGFPLGVCEPVLGPFPRGDPEALRAGADAWELAARRCFSEAEGLEGVASSVPGCLSGGTAVEVTQVLDGLAARKRDLAVYCESKTVECREAANAIELGQFTWIVMGSALVVELLASLAMPVGGMVAAAGVRAAARKGWQLAWVQLIESVMALCARLSASRAALLGQGIVAGGVFGGGVTWSGQWWQQHRGERDRIDWETVTVSGAGGAAGGLGAGVLYTRPVAGALARLQATGTRGAHALAMLLAGGAAGVAGGVTGTLGGAVAASAYRGDLAMPDGQEFSLGAVSGALEGLLSGGVHTIGHAATPRSAPAGLLGRPARAPKPSDLAEIFTRADVRASRSPGRSDLPGATATGSAHPAPRPGGRPAAPASSVEAVAESVGAAETATDLDPAVARTERLPPNDRSATTAISDLTTPGVTAEAGTTACTGNDSHSGSTTHGAPSAHSDTVARYSTGPATGDGSSVTTSVAASDVPAIIPPVTVLDSATLTPGNATPGNPPLADIAVTAADPGRSAVPTPSDPPVRTSATQFPSGAPNRPESPPNNPWTRVTEQSTPPRLSAAEHTPSPWRSQRNPRGEEASAPPAAIYRPLAVDHRAKRPAPDDSSRDGLIGARDIDETPVVRREGEAGPPMPRESATADERGWRQRRAEDESDLARVLYHRPETRQAVIAVIDRLRVVLSGLHPQATSEQIDNAFYTPEDTISGGMVLRSVPLDELRRDGNLRELMSAVQNAMWRSREIPHPSGTTLDDGLERTLNQPDWAQRAERLGLNVDALGRVRESITGGVPGALIGARELRRVGHAMSDPGYIAIREEVVHSGAIRKQRGTTEQVRRNLTVQDWRLLGMPLSLRELEAIPGDLVALRKIRLDAERPLPRDDRGLVDVQALETRLAVEDRAFRYAVPLYRYDVRGRRLRDESGHAVVDGVLAYHEEGAVDAATALRLDPHRFAVPLPWSPGVARFEFEKDGEWFRRTAVERGVPVGSGVSGTAARIAARYHWILPPGVPDLDFAGAILSLLLPQHHSLYETVRGMQMVGTSVVDAAVFRASDGMVADLYEAVFDRFGVPAPDGSARVAPLSTGGYGAGPARHHGVPSSAAETRRSGPEPERVNAALNALDEKLTEWLGYIPPGREYFGARQGDAGDPSARAASRALCRSAENSSAAAGEFELREHRIQSIFYEQVKPALLTDRPTRPLKQVEKPVLYVVGGQPGAGKSTLVDSIRDRLSDMGGAALIQADELEKFLPAYSRLYRENDFTAHDHLYPTALKLRNVFEDFLIPLPYNLLLEGGNSDPRGTLARIQRIGESRSRTLMEVIALPREWSDLARLERFVNGRETEGFGRYVTRQTHDRLYLGSSELVRLVESARPIPVDSLRIRTRADILYENHRSSGGQWHGPARGWVTLEDERNRKWTSEECRTFEDRIAGLREIVDSKVEQDPARWAPLVDEIDELRVLAEPKLSGPAT